MQKLLYSVITIWALSIMPSQHLFGQLNNEYSGQGSGGSISTGDNNTGFGDSTAVNLTSGGDNVTLGYKAGYGLTSQ